MGSSTSREARPGPLAPPWGCCTHCGGDILAKKYLGGLQEPTDNANAQEPATARVPHITLDDFLMFDEGFVWRVRGERTWSVGRAVGCLLESNTDTAACLTRAVTNALDSDAQICAVELAVQAVNAEERLNIVELHGEEAATINTDTLVEIINRANKILDDAVARCRA